jgi:transposase
MLPRPLRSRLWSLTWSMNNGQVEGQVTKLKLIKRIVS